MNNFLNKNISYIIISVFDESLAKDENDKQTYYLEDSLYLLDYTLESLCSYINGKSIYAQNDLKSNDLLRRDALWLLEKYNQTYAVVKYKGDLEPRKIFIDGRETPLKISTYDQVNDNMSYHHNGLSFSFVETKNYRFLQNKEQLRNGMVIEYHNGKEWKEKLVENIDAEWNDSYKLLIKYNKIRFSNTI